MKSSAVCVPEHVLYGRVLVLIALAVGIIVGRVQGQTLSFFRQFETPGMDRASVVAADGSGVYVIGNRGFSQGGSVRKYDSQGNELWTHEFDVPARSVHFLGAAADATGVYVAGYMRPVPLGDVTGQFVRKYSADGNELWTSPLDFLPMGGVTVDATGVYVAGRDHPPNASYLRKYSPAGAQLWTRRFGEPHDNYNPHGIAADATGVYMVGMRFKSGLFPFARKWDPNGSEFWNRQLDAVDAFIVAVADPVNVVM